MSNKNLGSFSEPPKAEYEAGINYLFIIGINKYKHCSDLNNAVKDVQDFRDLMLERFQFEKEHCFELLDEAATKKNIYNKIKILNRKLEPQDNLIIYFSGHGAYDKEFDEGYWIPTEAELNDDSQYISNILIRDMLGKIPVHHLFLIVDSCFSGALFIKNKMRNAAAKRKVKDPSRWGLTSGKLELVPDGEIGKNSPFASVLLKQLRQSDSLLRVGRLCDQVLENLSANNKQTPLGEPLQIKGHQNGEFVFHIKKDEKRDFAAAKAVGTVASYTTFLTAYTNGTFAEEAFWNIALLQNTMHAYFDYQKKYPTGRFYKEADKKIEDLEELEHWTTAKNRDTITGYNLYLQQHPHGRFVEEANKDRERLLLKQTPQRVPKPVPKPVEKQLKVQEKKTVYAAAKKEPKLQKPTFFKLHWKKLLAMVVFILAMLLLWKACNDGEEYYTYVDQGYDSNPTINSNDATEIVDSSTSTSVNDDEAENNDFSSATNSNDGAERETEEPTLNSNADLHDFLKDLEDELVVIDEGIFMMGDDDSGGTSEKPAHQVKVPSFGISKYEVSNKQYVTFLNDEQASIADVAQWISIEDNPDISKNGNVYTVTEGLEEHPVRYVSWYGAKAFCKWLGAKLGGLCRLPSEAEWEYAARANHNTTYSGSNNLNEVGWYQDNSGRRTHKRGELKPNAFGLYDMSGNVLEWCEDTYQGDYDGAPKDGSVWVKSGAAYRVLRGGDYWCLAIRCRSANRFYLGAGFSDNSIGFRLAFSPVP